MKLSKTPVETHRFQSPMAVEHNGGYPRNCCSEGNLIAKLAAGDLESTHYFVDETRPITPVTPYERSTRRPRTVASPALIGDVQFAGQKSGRFETGKRTYGGKGEFRNGDVSLHQSRLVLGPHDEYDIGTLPTRENVYNDIHPGAAGTGGGAFIREHRMERGDVLMSATGPDSAPHISGTSVAYRALATPRSPCERPVGFDGAAIGTHAGVHNKKPLRRKADGGPVGGGFVSGGVTAGAPTGYLERKMLLDSDRGQRRYPGIEGNAVQRLVFNRGHNQVHN